MLPLQQLGLRVIVASTLLARGVPAPIVIRHDRDDAVYQALGARYPSVGLVLPDGECTLIAPRFALTAAHVAAGASPFSGRVRFEGREYAIARIHLHPDWTPPEGALADIALLELAEPVEGIAPVLPYRGSDEQGKTVTFVGRGDTGTGASGPARVDGIKRGATNVVERTDGARVYFAFDAPPGGTDLEGISGPGDSGGPALLDVDGRLCTLGVSSTNHSGPSGRPCTYGSTEVYTRVSAYATWIDDTLRAAPAPTAKGLVLMSGEYPRSITGVTARKWFDAYASQDPAQIRAFEESERAPSALARRGVEERIRTLGEIRVKRGTLEPVRWAHGEGSLSALVRAERGEPWLHVRFEFDREHDGKLLGISIQADRAPEGAAGDPPRDAGDDVTTKVMHGVPEGLSTDVKQARTLPVESFTYDASLPHDLMIHSTERRDGIEVRDTSYADAAGERRGAYLVLPKAGGPHPAVLFVHGYEPESPTSNRTQFRDEAVELAQLGVVSLLVDTLWSEPTWFSKRDRARDFVSSIDEVKQLRRALDVLLAQQDVDLARVAYVGHDFGAMFGALVVALEPRVKAFAFQAGTTSFSDWYLLGTSLAPAEKQKEIDTLAELDPLRFIAECRPVATLYQFGTQDRYVTKPKAEELFAATRGPKAILWYEAGHGLDEQAVRHRVAWLKKTLKL